MTKYQDTLSTLRLAQDKHDYVKYAAQIYVNRQNRAIHPLGHTDSGGRWYPDRSERCECCNMIREPSRRWPYSLMIHCRTARHIARLYDVTEGQILAIAQTLE